MEGTHSAPISLSNGYGVIMTRTRALGFVITATLAMLAGTAQAVLAPNYQRLAELQAVLDIAAAVLNSEPIDAVERVSPDEYVVRAGPCVLTVRIIDTPTNPELIGPRQFKAEPGKPKCD